VQPSSASLLPWPYASVSRPDFFKTRRFGAQLDYLDGVVGYRRKPQAAFTEPMTN
jgi:hypothetical protein